MADLTVTAANVLPSANAVAQRGTAGEAITRGQGLYRNANDGKLYKAVATNLVAAEFVGIALQDAGANQPILYCAEDSDFTPGATLVTGTAYVVSATAGGLAPIADLVTGNIVSVVMLAKSTTKAVLRRINSGAAK